MHSITATLKSCTCARRWIREILARPVAASLSDLASASLCTTVQSFYGLALTCNMKRTKHAACGIPRPPESSSISSSSLSSSRTSLLM